MLPPACPAKNPPACSLTEIQGVNEKIANPEQEVVRITELADENSIKIHDEMMNEAGQEGNVMMNESGQEEDMIQLDEPSPGKKQDGANRKKNRPAVVVESQVRRSPRVKGQKMGFKNPQCPNKHCLGCNATPSVLTPKALRKLGSTLCDVDPDSIADAILSKKKKTAPVGTKSLVEAQPVEDDDEQPSKP